MFFIFYELYFFVINLFFFVNLIDLLSFGVNWIIKIKIKNINKISIVCVKMLFLKIFNFLGIFLFFEDCLVLLKYFLILYVIVILNICWWLIVKLVFWVIVLVFLIVVDEVMF